MTAHDGLLSALRAAPIAFVTSAADAGAALPAERRVVITGPPLVVDRLAQASIDMLAALIDALNDPAAAWGAEVVLSALTGRDGQTVDSFARSPEVWLTRLREPAAAAWAAWFAACRTSLAWDDPQGRFTWSAA